MLLISDRPTVLFVKMLTVACAARSQSNLTRGRIAPGTNRANVCRQKLFRLNCVNIERIRAATSAPRICAAAKSTGSSIFRGILGFDCFAA